MQATKSYVSYNGAAHSHAAPVKDKAGIFLRRATYLAFHLGMLGLSAGLVYLTLALFPEISRVTIGVAKLLFIFSTLGIVDKILLRQVNIQEQLKNGNIAVAIAVAAYLLGSVYAIEL